MKKLAIILPIFTFAIFCALTSVLGVIAGFFCILALGSEAYEEPAQVATVSVSDFLKDKQKREAKFNVAGFRGEIAKILYEDFCAKGIRVGAVQQAPNFALKDGVLKVSIDVNSPILIFKVVRSLIFYFEEIDGKLVLVSAKLAEAKIPLPIAKIVLKSTLKNYLACRQLSELKDAFLACKVKFENGNLVLEK